MWSILRAGPAPALPFAPGVSPWAILGVRTPQPVESEPLRVISPRRRRSYPYPFLPLGNRTVMPGTGARDNWRTTDFPSPTGSR